MNVIDSNVLRSGMRAENRYTLSSSRSSRSHENAARDWAAFGFGV
jgi:hypothetical protein